MAARARIALVVCHVRVILAPAKPKTKRPPELNRGGLFATAWLPAAIQAQYFLTLQPILHVGRACLLTFPVSANLTFPQSPSARSSDFASLLTVSVLTLAMVAPLWKYPIEYLFALNSIAKAVNCGGTFGSNHLCKKTELRFRTGSKTSASTIHTKWISIAYTKAILTDQIGQLLGFSVELENFFESLLPCT